MAIYGVCCLNTKNYRKTYQHHEMQLFQWFPFNTNLHTSTQPISFIQPKPNRALRLHMKIEFIWMWVELSLFFVDSICLLFILPFYIWVSFLIRTLNMCTYWPCGANQAHFGAVNKIYCRFFVMLFTRYISTRIWCFVWCFVFVDITENQECFCICIE